MDKTFQEIAEYYQQLAHRSAHSGNFLGARMAYCKSIQAWEKTVEAHPSLVNYLITIQREYRQFVQNDKGYFTMLRDVKRALGKRARTRQSDLYRELPHLHQTDLEYVIYFAVKNGDIRKYQRENEYEFFLPEEKKRSAFKMLLNKFSSLKHA